MSIDPKFSELIQADIDCEIGAEDKAALDAFLATSEEGRALYAEFEALSQSLDALGELESPAHLKHVLLGMAPTKSNASNGSGFLARLFAGPALGYVGTFAAGVVLSLAVVSSNQISGRAFDDVTGLVGTIADLEAIGPALSNVVVDETEVAGTVTLRSAGPLLILDFDLASRETIEIVASYADRTIWFNGFAQLESSGASVSAEVGLVRMAMKGKRRYALFLNNSGNRSATIDMKFVAGGEVVHEAKLRFTE